MRTWARGTPSRDAFPIPALTSTTIVLLPAAPPGPHPARPGGHGEPGVAQSRSPARPYL